MKALLQVVVAIAVFSVPSWCDAQESHEDTTSNLQHFVDGVINESVNANTLFASQEAFSTGRYAQRRSSDPDKDYTAIRIPARVVRGDKSDTVRPVFMGNGALLRTTTGVSPVDGIGEDDFTVTSLFALTAGSGLMFRLSESLKVVPSFSLSYSHIKNNYDYNNPYSQQNLAPNDRELFNWGLDLFTYTPALKVYYELDLGVATIDYYVGYTYLFNDSISSDSSVININSSTGLLTNRVDVPIPTGLSVEGTPLFIRPMFQWNNISGKAVAGLGLRDLYEVGADLVAKISDTEAILSTITVGASYVTGRDFEGYHIGLAVGF